MLVSLKCLKEFVDIPKSISPEDLASRLTLHTVEIDSVTKQAQKYNNIIVGKILEVKKHPNADKLNIAAVDVAKEVLSIVCGAANIKVGQIVPVAIPGAVLPSGIEIKESIIRGEASQGMLCAEDELELGDDHSGIMILKDSFKPGEAIADVLGFDDVVFEVDNKSITNRPDLWGYFGLAREIAAWLDIRLKEDIYLDAENRANKIKVEKGGLELKIKIENKTACPRYLALAMKGIKVEPSPKWLRERLISAGVRPINNIVDTTNYIMLQSGQPLHSFDLDKLVGNKNNQDKSLNIIIRSAKKKESILCLDGEERELTNKDLIIANEQGPIAIAGVMGGETSEVSEQSEKIVLEAANFEAISIRKTSQRLALRTEASMRFEKSLDPSLAEIALLRCQKLIKKICPSAEIEGEIKDKGVYRPSISKLELNLGWLATFIGQEYETKKIFGILKKLGFVYEQRDNDLVITIPSWRLKDIKQKEDIAEEIARIYSYEKLEAVMPRVELKTPLPNKERNLERSLRYILAGGGRMTEVYNYSFVGEKQLKSLGIDYSDYIRLANPISKNHTMLRQNLSSNIFESLKKNQARESRLELFEIGKVYLPIEGEMPKQNDGHSNLPLQEKRLAIAVAGSDNKQAFARLKGLLEYLLLNLESAIRFDKKEKSFYWARQDYAADIMVAEHNLGQINVLDKKIAKTIGLKKEVAIAELRLSELLVIFEQKKTYMALEKFPHLERDLAFVLDEKILYNDIKREIAGFHEYIKEVVLFDEYQGSKLGAGKKSLAFHVIYQADKTLESAEVDKIQSDLFAKLKAKYKAKLRDF